MTEQNNKAHELVEKISAIYGEAAEEVISLKYWETASNKVESILASALEEVRKEYEKVYQERVANMRGKCYSKVTEQDLKKAREEAVAEIGYLFQENVAKFPQELKEARKEARAATLEEAAKIAEKEAKGWDTDGQRIVEKIRCLAEKEKSALEEAKIENGKNIQQLVKEACEETRAATFKEAGDICSPMSLEGTHQYKGYAHGWNEAWETFQVKIRKLIEKEKSK